MLSTLDGIGSLAKFVANIAQTLVIGTRRVDPETATAVTGNLAIVKPTKAGYASVTQDPTNTPATSTINFPTGASEANGVFAPLDANHALSIVYKAASGATTDVVLDITGYFEPGTAGLRFVPLAPSRIMDTRSTAVLSGITGVHVATPQDPRGPGPLGRPEHRPGGDRQPDRHRPEGRRLRVGDPDPTATPTTSTLNFPLGDTIGERDRGTAQRGGESSFVYKAAGGKKTDLILDLSGYFE